MPVSDVNRIAEQAGFEVRDVENLREHYALTLRHWVTQLQVHQDEAVRIANETLYRTRARAKSGKGRKDEQKPV